MQIPETVLQIGANDWLGHQYRSVKAFNLGALQADFDALGQKPLVARAKDILDSAPFASADHAKPPVSQSANINSTMSN